MASSDSRDHGNRLKASWSGEEVIADGGEGTVKLTAWRLPGPARLASRQLGVPPGTLIAVGTPITERPPHRSGSE